MKRLTLLLVLLVVLYGGQARAGIFFLNPYGATVSGSVLNGEDPTQQAVYINGDIYGSGILTSSAAGSAGVDGGYVSSSAYVPSNQLILTANADTHLLMGTQLLAARVPIYGTPCPSAAGRRENLGHLYYQVPAILLAYSHMATG